MKGPVVENHLKLLVLVFDDEDYQRSLSGHLVIDYFSTGVVPGTTGVVLVLTLPVKL